MSNTLWLDPSFGASGDMLLGTLSSLLNEAGEPGLEILQAGLECLANELPSASYGLTEQLAPRTGISANHIEVATTPTDTPRHWSSIDTMLASSALPHRVKSGARATFRRLGEVEAKQHNVELEAVHFHEVGAIDAIVDIVGTWALFDHIANHFNVGSIVVGPVGLGHGTVQAAHGTLPLPAPATAALLLGMSVRSLDTETETCTPTGAALLAELADHSGPIPGGVIDQIGRGAGGRNPSTHPNVLTAVVLATDPRPVDAPPVDAGTPAVVLATNIDDATPEVLARTIQLLLEAGADDAWLVPIIMKKGRPANELRVLARPDLRHQLQTLLHRETGTLGIREESILKHVVSREFVAVDVRGHSISMKVGPYGAKPEFENLADLSDAVNVPVRILAIEAQNAFQASQRADEQT